MKALLKNPVLLAIVVTSLGVALLLLALNLQRLPFVNSHADYTVQLENAAGLKPGDDVRIAGVSVGTVRSMSVERGTVRTEIGIEEDLRLGRDSTASVELATVLGKTFLQLTSSGRERLEPGGTIPVSRTTVPYTLNTAFDAVGTTVEKTDVDTLAKSFDSVTDALSGTSQQDVAAVLEGVTALSDVIAKRRDEVKRLLDTTATVTGTLADRSQTLVETMRYSNTFLTMLNERREVLTHLLRQTQQLAAGVDRLISTNREALGASLKDLESVSAVLARNSKQLEASIRNLGLFSINITNATGTGPWLDLMLPLLILPDNIIKACGTNPRPGCGRTN